jgi:arylsulfatase A
MNFFSVLLLCSLMIFVASPAAAAPTETPNIIVIFADDMGYADIGPFGAEGYETPNLEAMAEQGMKFTNFLVGQSVCSPSRTSLMTGCYPIRVGVRGNFSPRSVTGINPDEMMLPEVVKQRGYATAMYGKWHLGHKKPFLPIKQGFDEWFGMPYSNDMWPYHPDPRYDFPDLPLMEGEKILGYNTDQTQLTTDYTHRAVQFIEQHKDEPFLIYLAHAMPHVPLFVSDKYKNTTERGLFGDVVSEIDWSVGQILATLKRLNIDEQTLVIFTSDNGPWLLYGDHGGSAGPFREGKGTMFEGGFRVPCIMRWPGTIPAGRECTELAATMDILPTVAGIVDAPLPPKKIDGLDILPLMTGKPGATTPHDVYYYYGGANLRGVRSGKWKLMFAQRYNVPDPPGQGGRHGERGARSLELSLFDLESDIGETTNVADQHPDVVARLQNLAEETRLDLGDAATERTGPNIRPLGRVEN